MELSLSVTEGKGIATCWVVQCVPRSHARRSRWRSARTRPAHPLRTIAPKRSTALARQMATVWPYVVCAGLTQHYVRNGDVQWQKSSPSTALPAR